MPSRHVRTDLDPSRVVSYNFNLNPHIIRVEPRYPNTCPNGWWFGMHPLTFRTITSRASLIWTWYEFARNTCSQPFPPACFRFGSTLAKVRSICALISRWITKVCGSQLPVQDVTSTIYSFGTRGLVSRVHTLACAFDAITNADGLAVIKVSLCFLTPEPSWLEY